MIDPQSYLASEFVKMIRNSTPQVVEELMLENATPTFAQFLIRVGEYAASQNPSNGSLLLLGYLIRRNEERIAEGLAVSHTPTTLN